LPGEGAADSAAADSAAALPASTGAIAPGAGFPPPVTGPPGFDFRLARLDSSLRGTHKPCDVARLERIGPSRALVLCWMGAAAVPVELELSDGQTALVDSIQRQQRILLEVIGPGDDRGGPEARVRLVQIVGPAPAFAAQPPAAAPNAAGFDFHRVNREAALHRTVRTCLVHSVARVARIDPAAGPGHPSAWFPAGAARYLLRVTCRHAGGTSRLVVGALEYQPLLAIRRDRAVQVRVWHQERFPQREAIGVIMGADGG
jgi:hypothetical protein